MSGSPRTLGLGYMAGEDIIEIMIHSSSRGTRRLWKAAAQSGIVDHPSDQSSPATLMCSSKSSARIAVKKFIEPHIILPVRIEVEHIISIVDGAATIIPASHEMLQAMLDFLRYATKMHHVSRACGTLYFELRSIEHIESLKRLDEEEIDT